MKSKWLLILFSVALCALAAWLAFAVLNQPKVNGRTFSEWYAVYERGWVPNSANREYKESLQAFREFGPRIAPQIKSKLAQPRPYVLGTRNFFRRLRKLPPVDVEAEQLLALQIVPFLGTNGLSCLENILALSPGTNSIRTIHSFKIQALSAVLPRDPALFSKIVDAVNGKFPAPTRADPDLRKRALSELYEWASLREANKPQAGKPITVAWAVAENAWFALAGVASDYPGDTAPLLEALRKKPELLPAFLIHSNYFKGHVPEVTALTTHSDSRIAQNAVACLNSIARNDSAVVEALIQSSTNHPFRSVRFNAVHGLGQVGPFGSPVVTTLVRVALQDKEDENRREAVESLRKIWKRGGEGKAAIEAFRAHATAPEQDVIRTLF